MQFVFPGFLFALSALSIPVIIHLFNFRRFKRIAFTNVRFLQEIKQDTRARSRLKHLLVLLARLLTMLFLVLAFAQPFIPMATSNVVAGVKHVSVFIDNSYSMDAVGKNSILIETAKKKAREIAKAYEPSDRFQLLTNDFEARHQRIVNREEFLQMIDEVNTSASVRNLSEIISRQLDALKNDNEKPGKSFLYEISDFQKSVSNLDEIKPDSSVVITFVPIKASETKNIYVDTCFLSSPMVQLNVQNELTVRLKNISDKDVENVPAKLMINGIQKSLATITVPSHGTVDAALTFNINEPGWQQAELSITDYPVTFDDKFYFSFEVKDHLSVLAINESYPSPYLNALFNASAGEDSYFQLKNAPVSQIDYSSFALNSLIVLNDLKEVSSGLAQELNKYLNKGGSVFVFPGGEIGTSYREFLQSSGANTYSVINESEDKVTYIERKHPMFTDVFDKKNAIENLDLPLVKKYYTINKAAKSNEEVLMRLQSGNAFLSSYPVGNGKLYLCAVPLEESYSNFPKHALFVPVLLKAAMLGFNASQTMIVGRNSDYFLNGVQAKGESVFHLINNPLKFDIIPESRISESKAVISVHDQVKNSGNYELQSEGKLISVLSFNYDRRESDLSCYKTDELKALADKAGIQSLSIIDEGKELTHTVSQLNEGTKLWKYCVLLALLFMTSEILLIRFMKS